MYSGFKLQIPHSDCKAIMDSFGVTVIFLFLVICDFKVKIICSRYILLQIETNEAKGLNPNYDNDRQIDNGIGGK